MLCRYYTRDNAPNQMRLLDAFEAANWERSIPSPFDLDRTLREAVDDLNEKLVEGSPISFRVENGRPIWEQKT
jgi:hypothetical protein